MVRTVDTFDRMILFYDSAHQESISAKKVLDDAGFVYVAVDLHKVAANREGPSKLPRLVLPTARTIDSLVDIAFFANHTVRYIHQIAGAWVEQILEEPRIRLELSDADGERSNNKEAEALLKKHRIPYSMMYFAPEQGYSTKPRVRLGSIDLSPHEFIEKWWEIPVDDRMLEGLKMLLDGMAAYGSRVTEQNLRAILRALGMYEALEKWMINELGGWLVKEPALR